MKPAIQPISSHRDIAPATQTAILLILALAWFLFCFSSGKIQHYSWYPYLLTSRISLCLAAIASAIFYFRRPSWLVVSRYMLLCLSIQSIFGALEPSNSLEFYQYCAYFLFIAAWSFSGTFQEWLTKFFPVAFLGLAIPVLFKDQALYNSVGRFVYEFTTTVAMIFLSFAAVISSSKRYQILMQNIDLRERLLAAEQSRKAEVEKEVDLLRSQIEEDSRSRAYLKVAEHVFHDLRSPLAMIKTTTKLAGDEISPEYAGYLHLGIQRMESIIADLARKGKIEPAAKQESTLTEIIASVVDEKKILIKERKNLEIDFSVPNSSIQPERQVVVGELKRVLSNVLANSVEAIPGPGKISVLVHQTDYDAEIVISDTGSGIPAEILPHLMMRGNSFGKATGSGLGLYYAKTTLEKWGGSLLLQSTEGKGTTVRMRVPALSV